MCRCLSLRDVHVVPLPILIRVRGVASDGALCAYGDNRYNPRRSGYPQLVKAVGKWSADSGLTTRSRPVPRTGFRDQRPTVTDDSYLWVYVLVVRFVLHARPSGEEFHAYPHSFRRGEEGISSLSQARQSSVVDRTRNGSPQIYTACGETYTRGSSGPKSAHADHRSGSPDVVSHKRLSP